jgi:hypothetical protein
VVLVVAKVHFIRIFPELEIVHQGHSRVLQTNSKPDRQKHSVMIALAPGDRIIYRLT